MHRKLWTKGSVQKSKRVSNLCKSTDTILCHVIFLDIYFIFLYVASSQRKNSKNNSVQIRSVKMVYSQGMSRFICGLCFLNALMSIHHGWCNLSGTRVLSLCCSFLRLINNEKKLQVIAGPPTTPLLHHSHALTHKNPPTIFQNDKQSILQTQVQTSVQQPTCLHHQRSSKLVPVGTSAVLSEAAFLGHKQCLNQA